MATVNSRVAVTMSANANGLVAGTKRAATAMENMQRSVNALSRQMRTLTAITGAQLFGSIVNYASQGVRSMVDFGQSTADTVDKMAKLSLSVGQTYAEFAGLAYAGDLAGVGMDSLATALTRADRVFVDAQQGATTAQDAFRAIGLSVDELVGKTSAERFEAIAGAINSLPDPAQKVAAAMEIFGRSGANLLPMFSQGAEGIAKAREEFDRFGGSLSRAQTDNVEAMNDAWTKVVSAVKAVASQVVANLAPAVKGVYDTILAFVEKAGGASIADNITAAFYTAAETLAAGIDYVWEQLTGAWEYASGVVSQFGVAIDVFSRVTAAINAVWYTGEAVLKAVAALLSRTIAGAAGLLDLLTDAIAGEGWAEFAASMEESANRLSSEADRAAAKAVSEGWRVVSGEAGDAMASAIEKPAGTLQSWAQRMRQIADNAKNAPTAASTAAVNAAGDAAAAKITSAGRDASKAISGVDINTTGGVNQIVAALNAGATDRTKAQQVELLRMIAKNTSQQSSGIKLEVAGV